MHFAIWFLTRKALMGEFDKQILPVWGFWKDNKAENQYHYKKSLNYFKFQYVFQLRLTWKTQPLGRKWFCCVNEAASSPLNETMRSAEHRPRPSVRDILLFRVGQNPHGCLWHKHTERGIERLLHCTTLLRELLKQRELPSSSVCLGTAPFQMIAVISRRGQLPKPKEMLF